MVVCIQLYFLLVCVLLFMHEPKAIDDYKIHGL